MIYPSYNCSKLELGAGSRPTPDYIHNDVRELDDIEVVCDIREIDKYVASGWTEIRATHVLEHFAPKEGVHIMQMVYNLLAPGGIFYIEVPNLTWQTTAHSTGEITDDQAVYYIFGEQDYLENTHKNGYTLETLARDLTSVGFTASVQDIGQVLIATGDTL